MVAWIAFQISMSADSIFRDRFIAQVLSSFMENKKTLTFILLKDHNDITEDEEHLKKYYYKK